MKNIKIDNVEISIEALRKAIKDNPEILKPEVKGRYFFPKKQEEFIYVNAFGLTDSAPYDKQNDDFVSMGVFLTVEDARLASAKQKAIVACWKWAQENEPFEPDWGNDEQEKYCVYYNYESNRITWRYEFNDKYQFTLPYFGTTKDIDAFMKACKEHLELLFTK